MWSSQSIDIIHCEEKKADCYLGSLSFNALVLHFFVDIASESGSSSSALYYSIIETSEYYIPKSLAFQDKRDKRHSLLGSLRRLSSHTLQQNNNNSGEIDPFEWGLALPFSGDRPTQDALEYHLLPYISSDASILLFRIMYYPTDPLLSVHYSREIIEITRFLPTDVIPISVITHSHSNEMDVLVVGCQGGYICQYDIKHRRCSIVRYGIEGIHTIQSEVSLQGDTILIAETSCTKGVIIIPSEGYDIEGIENTTTVGMNDNDNDNNKETEKSIWNDCSSDAEDLDISFFPSESMFESFTSDIISPKSEQTSFLSDAGMDTTISFIFKESDIYTISSSSKDTHAFIIPASSGTLVVLFIIQFLC
jgi:hypothetical protein